MNHNKWNTEAPLRLFWQPTVENDLPPCSDSYSFFYSNIQFINYKISFLLVCGNIYILYIIQQKTTKKKSLYLKRLFLLYFLLTYLIACNYCWYPRISRVPCVLFSSERCDGWTVQGIYQSHRSDQLLLLLMYRFVLLISHHLPMMHHKCIYNISTRRKKK